MSIRLFFLLGDMLLHLLGIFDANLLQHYLFLEDLQSFDHTCSKEPDQIMVANCSTA